MNESTIFAKILSSKSVPFSFWTHFPEDDLDAKRLAVKTIEFQKKYSLDFLKTMPSGMYCIEDYGVTLDYSEIKKGGVAKLIKSAYQNIEDLKKIHRLDVNEGALAREIKSLVMLKESVSTPVFFTVFSPMTILSKLTHDQAHLYLSSESGRSISHMALTSITQDVIELCNLAIKNGADGIFFAHQDTGFDKYSESVYEEFIRPYDYEVLGGLKNSVATILHLHGNSIRFHSCLDYPIDAINWHVGETLPTIKAVQMHTDKILIGGLDRMMITNNNISYIKEQASKIRKLTKRKANLIATPGCTIRSGYDESTLIKISNLFNN